MAAQGGIAGFLNNADSAQKLNDLVDDIREAVMDYQVRTSRGLALITSNVRPSQTSLQRDIYENTHQIIVSCLFGCVHMHRNR